MCIHSNINPRPRNPNGWKVVVKTKDGYYLPVYSVYGIKTSRQQKLFKDQWAEAQDYHYGFHYWPSLNAARLQLLSNIVASNADDLVIVKVRAKKLKRSGYCNSSQWTENCIAIEAEELKILEEVPVRLPHPEERHKLLDGFLNVRRRTHP